MKKHLILLALTLSACGPIDHPSLNINVTGQGAGKPTSSSSSIPTPIDGTTPTADGNTPAPPSGGTQGPTTDSNNAQNSNASNSNQVTNSNDVQNANATNANQVGTANNGQNSNATNANQVTNSNNAQDLNTTTNPNARPVFACGGGPTCIVLGTQSVAPVGFAALTIQIPQSAASSGEIFYAALVDNSNNAIRMVRRGQMHDTGAQIYFPRLLPLPGATADFPTPSTFKVYVWSATTAVVVYDLGDLVLHGNETDAAHWDLILKLETRTTYGVQAVVDYSYMTKATASVDIGALTTGGGFSAMVDVIMPPLPGPGGGSGNFAAAAMDIQTASQVVVYSSLYSGGGLSSTNVMEGGQSYTITLYSQIALDEVPAGVDPNTFSPSHTPVTTWGDTVLFVPYPGTSVAFVTR